MIPTEDLNFKKLLNNVKAIVLDVDGVLSGNKVLMHDNGELIRTANVKDGFAIQYAVRMGLKVGIITGGWSEVVQTRYSRLGVKDIYIKCKDKRNEFEDFLIKNNLEAKDVLYMGDDLLDYHVMKIAGIAVCPKDAASEIKAISVYISDYCGGEACVRDIIEQVMRAQGKWMTEEAFVL
ncbi:MAG TPA: HAD hydrolase family protein [Bacteroidales bacterium]|jgi:3-deoxy-D-manno-octulosonate 8-phosphate phosphatase (KDO 8-P phosphatase)|nr:HAD hydrolase family protein [Bacteroidales bacterium]MDD4236036.1 HAD hydrolase family protein [Bacteroidales bacterium]MDY0159753.1 HAD hydrolase family protein [Bacteroidales bacterium]HRW20882.1 HAD hydrolase family protein [Bacteroidales bacterium]HXK82190.1 HAD hydrolase family protein [Bacteroidales bacterium]